MILRIQGTRTVEHRQPTEADTPNAAVTLGLSWATEHLSCKNQSCEARSPPVLHRNIRILPKLFEMVCRQRTDGSQTHYLFTFFSHGVATLMKVR